MKGQSELMEFMRLSVRREKKFQLNMLLLRVLVNVFAVKKSSVLISFLPSCILSIILQCVDCLRCSREARSYIDWLIRNQGQTV